MTSEGQHRRYGQLQPVADFHAALELPVPHSVEAQSSSSCEINNQVSTIRMNDFAFSYANRVCSACVLMGDGRR